MLILGFDCDMKMGNIFDILGQEYRTDNKLANPTQHSGPPASLHFSHADYDLECQRLTRSDT